MDRPPDSGSETHLTEVLFSFQTGGSERVGAAVARHAAGNGRSTSACATHGGPGPILHRLEEAGVTCEAVGDGSLGRIGRALRLYRHFRRHGTSVVHVQHFNVLSIVLGPARLAGVDRVVVTEHTDRELRTRPKARRIATRHGRRADDVTVVHQGIADFLIEELDFDPSHVHVIPNGVDTGRFQPRPSVLREALEIPAHRVLVGSVGRLHPDKDPLNLVRALRSLGDEGREAIHLAIVGDGACRAELEAQIRDAHLADRVTLLGERHDIPELLAALDVFAMPSKTEGLPVALLEAMASGLPIVATDVGGVAAALGDCGLVVPPQDATALGEAILRLAGDPERRRQLGRAARERAVQRFDIGEMFSAYDRILRAGPGGERCAA